MSIIVKVPDNINKPIAEVFDAIVNPEKLAGYFVSKASGPVKENETIEWYFGDVEVRVSVDVKKVVQNELISFVWSANRNISRVEINLKSLDSGSTNIEVTESRFPFDEEGVNRALEQTKGWTYFLCCLKAYVCHGINLREGITRDVIILKK